MSGFLFSHPTGNANVRAALVGLFEAGILKEFHTSIASYPGNLWDVLGRSPVGREFHRRKFDERLRPITVQYPFRELCRMSASRLKVSRLLRHEAGAFCIDAIYRKQDCLVARRVRDVPELFDGVYAYEDGAMETMIAAREQGLPRIYDLPIGHWRAARKLLKSELERMPEWSATLTSFHDSEDKLNRKDAELGLATKIIVASTFTARTLKDYDGNLVKPIVIPYGFPPVCRESNRTRRGPITKENPLRLLFVGGLSQRKGVADLFAAVERVGNSVSLTVIGGKVTDDCIALEKNLARHRWIPTLPHNQILDEMRSHDVLVFPSLFEGFGLVISEAMSQGTPVITTARTAGPDLIRHGENGWLTEAGSVEALVRQLEEIISNPKTLEAAGINARNTAAARPWSVYGGELADVLMKSL